MVIANTILTLQSINERVSSLAAVCKTPDVPCFDGDLHGVAETSSTGCGEDVEKGRCLWCPLCCPLRYAFIFSLQESSNDGLTMLKTASIVLAF